MNAASSGARPAVTVKLATSLDGRIATASGESRWITGEAAREQGHRLRAEHDAVLVGSGTATTDDPELTVRLDPPPARQPVRMVVDSRGALGPNAKLFRTLDKGPVVIATREDTDLDAAGWPERDGVQYWMLPPEEPEGSVSLTAFLDMAGEAGIRSVLVEGGGRIAAAFVRAGLVDRLEWFRAPILLGAEGRPCMGDLGLEKLAEAPQFKRTSSQTLGPDAWDSFQRAD